MFRILCFGKTFGADFVERYLHANEKKAALIYADKLGAQPVLNEKPDLVLLTENEIDRLLEEPLLPSMESFHRFSVFAFLSEENLNYRLNSYKVGAEECLSSVMSTPELEYKMAILLHRASLLRAVPPDIRLRNLTIFPAHKRVLINDQEIRLANKEYEILLLLVKESHRFVTTDELIEKTWKGTIVSPGNIYTQIHNLKKKLKGFDGEISSVYGVGFKLEEQKLKS